MKLLLIVPALLVLVGCSVQSITHDAALLSSDAVVGYCVDERESLETSVTTTDKSGNVTNATMKVNCSEL